MNMRKVFVTLLFVLAGVLSVGAQVPSDLYDVRLNCSRVAFSNAYVCTVGVPQKHVDAVEWTCEGFVNSNGYARQQCIMMPTISE